MPLSHPRSNPDSKSRLSRPPSAKSSKRSTSTLGQTYKSPASTTHPKHEQSPQRSAQPPRGPQLHKSLSKTKQQAQRVHHGQSQRQPQKQPPSPAQRRPRSNGALSARALTSDPGTSDQKQGLHEWIPGLDSGARSSRGKDTVHFGLQTRQGLRELPGATFSAHSWITNRTRQIVPSGARTVRIKKRSNPTNWLPEREAYVFKRGLDCQSIANKYCQADSAFRQTTQAFDPHDQLVANIGTSTGDTNRSRFGWRTSLLIAHRSRIPSGAPMWACLTAGGNNGPLRNLTTCDREPYLRNLTTSCRAASDLNVLKRLSVRSMLQLPLQGAKSCAVVGSSGSLLYERFGDEIDAHDVVIRRHD
mmetsp:Transcript_31986/g.67315  ORF Transcript_31986/g.67315 Transcript_31986/m.67315 type:complete len:360 (+) Transcript_31986:455-1534(+)